MKHEFSSLKPINTSTLAFKWSLDLNLGFEERVIVWIPVEAELIKATCFGRVCSAAKNSNFKTLPFKWSLTEIQASTSNLMKHSKLISPYRISPARKFANVINYILPPTVLKTSPQQIVSPTLPFRPFRQTTGKQLETYPLSPKFSLKSSSNWLPQPSLSPPLGAKWLIFQGFTRKSNIAWTPPTTTTDINKSLLQRGSPPPEKRSFAASYDESWRKPQGLLPFQQFSRASKGDRAIWRENQNRRVEKSVKQGLSRSLLCVTHDRRWAQKRGRNRKS